MRVLLFVVLMFCMGTALGQEIDAAFQVASRYSRAVIANDADSMVAMTHPSVIKGLGGDDQMRKTIADMFRNSAEAKSQFTSESINEIREYSFPQRSLFLVRTTRSIESFPGPLFQPSLYVVVTEGTSQWVVDLGCISTAHLKMLEPGFTDEAAVEELLSR